MASSARPPQGFGCSYGTVQGPRSPGGPGLLGTRPHPRPAAVSLVLGGCSGLGSISSSRQTKLNSPGVLSAPYSQHFEGFASSKTSLLRHCRPPAPGSSENMFGDRFMERAKAIPGMDTVVEAFVQQPPTWASSLIVTSTVFALGYFGLASGLSSSGIAAAYALGLVVWRAFGFPGFGTVCLYFIVGTAVTKVRMTQKEAEGIAEKKKGRRGPGSVMGSGLAGAICALSAIGLGVNSASVGAAAWTFRLLELGFVASFCTKLSDTTSSEIGKAYGRSTFLVTTLQPVPRGTEGAISLEGTVAGIVAAAVLAIIALFSGEVSVVGALICIVSSQIANYGESYLGATLQEKPGYEWLNNDLVNVLNISTGAALAILAGRLLPAV